LHGLVPLIFSPAIFSGTAHQVGDPKVNLETEG